MTEEQIQEMEWVLNAYFIAENDGKYGFEISTVEDAIITFDTNRGLVYILKTSNPDEPVALNLDELENITKACEDVLGW